MDFKKYYIILFKKKILCFNFWEKSFFLNSHFESISISNTSKTKPNNYEYENEFFKRSYYNDGVEFRFI